MIGKILTLCTAAYNAEKYISKMIESVVTSKNRELVELLIVNDGSTDNTENVAREYEEKYSNCIKVFSKENGGSGSARNYAFQHASGKYIKLLDADDWVDTDKFDKYLEALVKIDADVIWNEHYIYYVKKKTLKEEKYFDDFISGRINKCSDGSFSYPKNLEMHGVTYRTSIIVENNIKFSEGMPYVDLEYLLLPIPFLKTIVYLNIPFYVYQYGIEGQSVDPNIMKKKGDQVRRMVERLLQYYEIHSMEISDNSMQLMNICLVKACNAYLNVSFVQEDYKLKEDVICADKWIKERNGAVWNRMSTCSGSVKIMRLFNYRGYNVMVFLHKIYRIANGWKR